MCCGVGVVRLICTLILVIPTVPSYTRAAHVSTHSAPLLLSPRQFRLLHNLAATDRQQTFASSPAGCFWLAPVPRPLRQDVCPTSAAHPAAAAAAEELSVRRDLQLRADVGPVSRLALREIASAGGQPALDVPHHLVQKAGAVSNHKGSG